MKISTIALLQLVKVCISLLCLVASPVTWGADTVYKVGITAFREKPVTRIEWQPTIDYLASKVPGSKFEVVPMDLAELKEGISTRQIDFVITNPEHYTVLEYSYGVSRVATLVRKIQGNLLKQFGGVIFTKASRADINQLSDVKYRQISAVDKNSFGGFLLQKDELQVSGVDINSQAKMLITGFPQDLCVYSVLEGKSDVGFVRTGILEAMAREGKISLSQVKVLNPVSDPAFPFLLSTKLYPEWAFAVTNHVPFEVTNQVVSALMLMPAGTEISNAAQYDRWVPPLEYQSVQVLMRKHKVFPFDAPEVMTLNELFAHYGQQLVLVLTLVLSMFGVLYFRAKRLNYELNKSKEELKLIAHFDHLTGLPNRRILEHDTGKAVASCARNGSRYALAMLDLDGFKPINDQLGHDAGDATLIAVAKSLKECVRSGDTVSRWGGDEFALLFEFATQDQLKSVLDRVLSNISGCIDLPIATQLSASIGVVVVDGSVKDFSTLLKMADDAMYVAKGSGGHCYSLSEKSVLNEFEANH